MAGFLGEGTHPRSETVDSRYPVTLTWFYYFNETDNPVQYYLVSWKPAATRSWSGALTYRVNFPENKFQVPPYTIQENQAYSWKVEAFATNPTTGALESQGVHINMMETSGFTLVGENIFDPNNSGWILFQDAVPPGEYEVRMRVRNSFQWSSYSGVQTVKLYDTRRFVRKSSKWWAVPVMRKQGGDFKTTK